MVDDRLLPSASQPQIDDNFCRVLDIMDQDSGDISELYSLIKLFVTFDSDGGSPVESQLIKYDTVPTEPEDPTKEGYTFAGWFIGEDEYDFTAKLKADTELKASWEAETEG